MTVTEQHEQGAGSDTDDQTVVLTRAQLIAQIQARLAGKLDDSQLAAWAFDRFYAEEIGEVDFESGAEPVIADALDALMFGDDPGFRLDAAELQALISRLSV